VSPLPSSRIDSRCSTGASPEMCWPGRAHQQLSELISATPAAVLTTLPRFRSSEHRTMARRSVMPGAFGPGDRTGRRVSWMSDSSWTSAGSWATLEVFRPARRAEAAARCRSRLAGVHYPIWPTVKVYRGLRPGGLIGLRQLEGNEGRTHDSTLHLHPRLGPLIRRCRVRSLRRVLPRAPPVASVRFELSANVPSDGWSGTPSTPTNSLLSRSSDEAAPISEVRGGFTSAPLMVGAGPSWRAS
jgi:hypothetical protein